MLLEYISWLLKVASWSIERLFLPSPVPSSHQRMSIWVALIPDVPKESSKASCFSVWPFPSIYLYFLTHENVYFIRHVFVYLFVYCNMSPIKLKYIMIFWFSVAWCMGVKWYIFKFVVLWEGRQRVVQVMAPLLFLLCLSHILSGACLRNTLQPCASRGPAPYALCLPSCPLWC